MDAASLTSPHQNEETDARYFTSFRDQLGERGERPTRAGYFAGYQVVSHLARQHSLGGLVRWSPGRAKAAVRQTLELLTEPHR